MAIEKMTESQEVPTRMVGEKNIGENKSPMPAVCKTSVTPVQSYADVAQKPTTPEQIRKVLSTTQSLSIFFYI
jgi:hypothetical protein